MAGVSLDPSDPPDIPGKRRPLLDEAEDQQVEERLALEGVEEALHDQMLADCRRREP